MYMYAVYIYIYSLRYSVTLESDLSGDREEGFVNAHVEADTFRFTMYTMNWL